MLKKIFLVIDVTDEAQRDRVQLIANELSNMRAMNGTQIENIYPYYRQYENDIRQLFYSVSRNGLSAQAMMSIGKLASKMIRKK